jgi:hypothetical protein
MQKWGNFREISFRENFRFRETFRENFRFRESFRKIFCLRENFRENFCQNFVEVWSKYDYAKK